MGRLMLIASAAGRLLTGCTSADTSAADQTRKADGPAGKNHMTAMKTMTPSSQDSAATREYKQAMVQSMQGAPPFTGNAGRDFMQQMRVRHQAAIQMSETLLKHGKDQQTRALAQEIISAQQREIAEIDRWLFSRR